MAQSETDDRLVRAIRTIVQEEVATAMAAAPQHSSAPAPAAVDEVPAPLKGADPYSLVPFVRHVLNEAGGGPLHARDMAPRVYALGFQHKWPPKYPDQLVRSINSLASPSQHPDVFERVAPRTLRLR